MFVVFMFKKTNKIIFVKIECECKNTFQSFKNKFKINLTKKIQQLRRKNIDKIIVDDIYNHRF